MKEGGRKRGEREGGSKGESGKREGENKGESGKK